MRLNSIPTLSGNPLLTSAQNVIHSQVFMSSAMKREDPTEALVSESLSPSVTTISTEQSIALVTVNIVASILGSLGNVFVCATVYRTPCLRTNFGFFVCSLAFADFLVSFLAQPTVIAILILGEIQKEVPQVVTAAAEIVTFISCGASLASLWLLSIDRCICILSPLRYKTLVTRTRVKAAILFVWLAACSLMSRYIFPFLPNNIFLIIAFCILVLSYATMCVCYALVFRKIRQQSRIRRRMCQNSTQVFEANEQSSAPARKEKARREDSNAAENKLARTIAIILGVFTLVWAPIGYVFVASNNFSHAVLLWAITLGLCNSAMNPIIYCYRSKEHRNAFKKMLSRCFCSNCASSRVGVVKPREEIAGETPTTETQKKRKAATIKPG